MRVVLAISGGVDSMVMLDIFAKFLRSSGKSGNDSGCALSDVAKDYSLGDIKVFQEDSLDEIIVAHFDHSTRESSKTDAEFVQRRAQDYQLPFVLGDAELGEYASEEAARQARYNFLHQVRKDYNCNFICTAHHLDDLVESIAINLLRGTGWRGLAALDSPYIIRPFLEFTESFDKAAVYRYAAKHQLPFRQDPTNVSDVYLRNRVRQRLAAFASKRELYQMWYKQKQLKSEIDKLVEQLLPLSQDAWQRDWFHDLDEKVALELLRTGTMRAGISATRPQLENFRQAILTYSSGKSFNLPQDKLIKFSKNSFIL